LHSVSKLHDDVNTKAKLTILCIFMSKKPKQFSHLPLACILINELHQIWVTFSASLKGLRTSVIKFTAFTSSAWVCMILTMVSDQLCKNQFLGAVSFLNCSTSGGRRRASLLLYLAIRCNRSSLNLRQNNVIYCIISNVQRYIMYNTSFWTSRV